MTFSHSPQAAPSRTLGNEKWPFLPVRLKSIMFEGRKETFQGRLYDQAMAVGIFTLFAGVLTLVQGIVAFICYKKLSDSQTTTAGRP